MKNLIISLLTAFLIIIINSVSAQSTQVLLKNKSGIYNSFADFKEPKLHLEADCTKEKNKIIVDRFLNKSEIVVKQKGNKFAISKKDIYGFRDCKGDDYRIFNNTEYKIIATDTIYLYTKIIAETKSSGRSHITYFRTKYYFSKSGESEILPLSLINLEKTFPENHKLHDALYLMFKNESELIAYDDFHKMYKIISFLKEFLN